MHESDSPGHNASVTSVVELTDVVGPQEGRVLSLFDRFSHTGQNSRGKLTLRPSYRYRLML